MDTPLSIAIKKAGGQLPLGRKIGVSQQRVWSWLNRLDGKVTPEYCLAIEQATGVSRHDLRPDVFGPSPSEAA